MKKFIITLLVLLTVYIGCVVWITWGMELQPYEKILICVLGCFVVWIAAGFKDYSLKINSMTTKTAMQELIEIIDNEVYNHTDEYSRLELMVYARIKNKCLYLLEKEKHQIIDAYDIRKIDIAFDKKKTGDDYYNQTYINEKL